MFRLSKFVQSLTTASKYLVPATAKFKPTISTRHYKVSIIGGSNPTAQTLCLLLKEHPSISRLSLFDFPTSTLGLSVDLSHIPSEPRVHTKPKDSPEEMLQGTQIVVLSSSEPKTLGQTDYDLFKINADYILLAVQEISKHCPDAFIVNVTEPVNFTTPFVSLALQANNAYNSKKVFGVTGREAWRAQMCLRALYDLPKDKTINVPVICGSTSKTTVPLLSHITPWFNVDRFAAVLITEHVRGTENQVISMQGGVGQSSLSNAYAGFCTVASMLKALEGRPVKRIIFVANDEFSTKYFACPVIITKEGIEKVTDYTIFSTLEAAYLQDAIKALSKEINQATTYYKELTETQKQFT